MKKSIVVVMLLVAFLFADDRIEDTNLYICFPNGNSYWPEVESDGVMFKNDSNDTLTCLEVTRLSFEEFTKDTTGFLVTTKKEYENEFDEGYNPYYLFLKENKKGVYKNFRLINIFQDEGLVYQGPNSFPGESFFFLGNKEGYLRILKASDITSSARTEFVFKKGKFIINTKE